MNITTRYSAPEVRQLVAALVDGITGPADDPRVAALVRGIKLRAGMVALSLIQTAYLDKARGGVGEDGIQWKPLDPRTIAYGRRLGPGYPQPVRPSRRHGSRPYLTDDHDKRWRMLFATRKGWLMAKFGLSEGEAAARAAMSAWATVKAEGGKTKLEVLGNREVEIGRDTGRLFNSLSPGVIDPAHHPITDEPGAVPAPAEEGDRILDEDLGAVIVGTAVSYATDFHAVRPLWPNALPAAWMAEILRSVKEGILEALGILLAA